MPDNLPLARTSFVGRGADLARLESLIGEAAVVTVTGPGGVGKTRIALEAAHRVRPAFPDGVWFAELAAVRSVDVAVAEVARLVGVTPGSGDPVQLLVEQLADRRVLLVVDNCEHLVDGVARLVHRLVAACPRVRVLATSREPLAVGAEVTVPLAPLDGVDAVRLFLDRARAADPDAPVGGDDDEVAALCARLDHIPLAIELAAPWIRVFSPAELLPRLANRFELLTAARRDLPPRQTTMRAAVDWSYQLLPDGHRVLFRRLAAFNGTFALDAAEAVCGFEPLAAGEVGALLAGLHERSMVVVDRSAGGSRYRLLETLKDFAAEQLEAAGEDGAARRGHFAHYLDRAERVDADRLRTGSDAQVATLVPDADNYRAALAWGIDADPAGALRLAGALEGLWMIRSVAEGGGWVRRALSGAPEPTTHRARALIVAPLVVAGGLPWPEARSMVEESIAIYAAAGDRAGEVSARLTMSMSAMFNGELAEARRHVEDVRRDDDHPLVRARADTYLGAVFLFTPRRLDEARRLLRRGFEAAHAIGDGWGSGLALTLLGLADLRAGYQELAGGHLRDALRSRMQGGVTATAIGGLGELAGGDHPHRALTLLEAAVAVRERAGVPAFPVLIGGWFERARAAARERLAPPVAQRCRDRARAMTTEEVLAYALAERDPARDGEAGRLTARQQEVALLVADGLTNREIAARLHLSVRTVETHVDNALTALGFHSRARLAGWVREVELAPPPEGR